MIAKLDGIVDSLFLDRLILSVSGIGFEVLCSKRTLSALTVGQKASLWTEHIVREDAQILCGFLSSEEQACFRELTSVSSVGIKAALGLLSALSVGEIVAAITTQDKATLTRAEGVGPKMAERLMIDLRNSKFIRAFALTPATNTKVSKATSTASDAIEALVALGYERFTAQRVVLDMAQDFSLATTEELIKLALSRMAGG